MPTASRLQKMKQVAAQRQPGLLLVVEDIHDPHNAAAMLRTCDAFGIQEVWFIFEQEKRYNPARVGKTSSSSANTWLDFKVFTSTKACYTALKKQKYHIVATALDVTAKDVFKANFTAKKLALVMGNEHRGLSAYAMENADEKVYIPMRGMVQSLNVSVTAATMLFEITRQRMVEPGKFAPTKAEIGKILKSLQAKK